MPPPPRTAAEDQEEAFPEDDLWEQVGADEAVVVSEPRYFDTGEAQHDASEIGWSGSVHDQPEDEVLAEPEPPPEPLDTAAAEEPPFSAAAETNEYDPVSDFFDDGSGFTYGDEAPPSEDVPSAMTEDLAQTYSTPMGVPEPPPLPGLVDRFTPAPVSRPAGAPLDDRPLYEPTPVPAAPRVEVVAPEAIGVDDDEDSDAELTVPGPGFPRQVLIGGIFGAGLMLVFALVVVAVFGALTGGGPSSTQPGVTSPVRSVTPPGVEVRSSLIDEGLGDDTDTEIPTDLAEPETTSEGPAEAAPTPPQAPATAARPAPRPKPAPARTAPIVTRTGTLKVRANRKVLITLNGRPVDYAPLDLPVTPGTYILGAALPGRPDTEQSKTVDISAGAIERVEFTF